MIRRGIEALHHHHRDGTLKYGAIAYLLTVHLAAFRGAWLVVWGGSNRNAAVVDPATCLWAVVLWWISGFGVTVGAHRLWSHRSYEAHGSLKLVLMLMHCIANQGNLYQWVRDHRLHHRFSETDADPHDARRGFFFAHMGFLMVQKKEAVVREGRKIDISDIEKDPYVMIQKRANPWLALYMCFVFPAQVASHYWGENFWTAMLVAGAFRYVFVLHCTFLVNSAAHLYGDRPYDPQSHPTENPIVSYFALGEGWHNWHHKYPFDYAASEFGISSQFNPSKMFIDFFALLGLVWGRKRGTSAWALRRTRIRSGKDGAFLHKLPELHEPEGGEE